MACFILVDVADLLPLRFVYVEKIESMGKIIDGRNESSLLILSPSFPGVLR